MLTLYTHIHALSPFISTKYYKLGHWGSTGSCKYCTEKNTENKFSLRTQQTTVARREQVLMLFATPGTRPTTYFSQGAKFTPTYNRILLELRWHYMDVIAGWIPRALQFFVQLGLAPFCSCTASRRGIYWMNRLIMCSLSQCPLL